MGSLKKSLKHASLVIDPFFLPCCRCLLWTEEKWERRCKKGGEDKKGGNNGGGICSTQYQTVCSESFKNECSTSYVSQCGSEAVTTYEEECKVEIVGTEPAEICTTEIQEICEEAIETSYKTECTSSPVSECSTTYVRECYRGRKKRGLLQAVLLNQALNQRHPETTEAPEQITALAAEMYPSKLAPTNPSRLATKSLWRLRPTAAARSSHPWRSASPPSLLRR